MNVSIKVKSIGKRKPVIDSIPMEIGEEIVTSSQLVEFLVRRNVQEFNRKETDQAIFPYLTKQEIEGLAFEGKVGFDDKKNETIQDEDEAVKNALECYADGIFKVFINEQEAAFGVPVEIKAGDELILIRLTMLAGALW